MRRNPAVALSIGIVLLVAACGGAAGPSAAPSTASSAPPAEASPTTASVETPSPDPSVAPSPTGDDTSGLPCQSGEMPNLDSGWKFLRGGSGTFGVAYPDDWEDLSGGDFTVASLLDSATFAELGLASDATIKADFVRDTEGLPNLSVFRFGKVESSATVIRDREVARFGDLSDVERIVDPAVDGCLGGSDAAGLSLEFRSTDSNLYYQQNLFTVRNGELYAVQWLDRLSPNTDLLAEILTTWGWMLG